ncbi:MAG: ABC transporter permease [Acidimicrobiia bacterium]
MLKYVLRRVGASALVLLIATAVVFVLVREFGPDPAEARCRSSRNKVACEQSARVALGLNDPLHEQYFNFMGDFLQGDWGNSQRSDRSVAASISDDLWDTAQLAFWGVLVSVGLAVTIGGYSARKPYSKGDSLFTGIAFAGISMPTFWFGLITIHYLTGELKDVLGTSEPIFYSIPNPVGSGVVEYARELTLPVLVLSVQLVAGWSRYQRSSMLDELHHDYIRTARAKGLSERRVVWKHGLRNSLSPLVTVIALDFGGLFGGLIITETVFARHGMGRLLVDAAVSGDTQVLIPWMFVTGAIIILFNLLADVLYAVLDPRVRVA